MTPLLQTDSAILVYFLILIALIYWARSQWWGARLFEIFPPIIWFYFLPMLSTTAGITPEEAELYDWATDHLLPAALLLLLLSADVRAIAKLGPKAIATMLAGTVGIVLGGVVSLAIFGSWLPSDAWKGMGALSGSWIGGSSNMAAIGKSLEVRDELFGVMIVVDAVVGYGWMLVVIALSAFQARVDRWNRVTSSPVAELTAHVRRSEQNPREPLTFEGLSWMTGLGIGGGYLCVVVGGVLPPLGDVVTNFGWAVILVSLLGLLLSFTPVAKLERHGASHLGNFFLAVLIATIGAKANLQDITEVPLFMAVGVVWILVHATVLFTAGRLLRAPMFLIATSSQANIGGVVSAPIVASVYQKGLAPVGLLMGVLGNFLGIYFGFLTAQLMSWVAQALGFG